MSILKTIFRLFKTSGMYNSYSPEQQSVINEICNIHLACNKTENIFYDDDTCLLLQKLEKTVSRRVLSASIPIQKLSYLLGTSMISPGDLELVNAMDDILDEIDRTYFFNMFVAKCNVLDFRDRRQLEKFPKDAIVYLDEKNKKFLEQFKF